ncbi:hypothetical protein C8A01DRAFT_16264 [Parachaetomium inaequale]|uniref:DUF4048 domain-containing protein n=1 Tax=Parachaetomium inaequale TaxID=2588326 RepID=A0AAN6PFQ4_9PEZI|nr:hypothetical protein C8A01DRAFT_16264 [Parachaetomium inaequale]
MTSVGLLRTSFVSACANTLFNTRDSNPLDLHKAAVVARRTTRPNATPLPHRLPRRSLATTARPGRRRRILRKPSHSFTLPKLPTKRAEIARRIPKKTEDMDEMVLLQRSMDENMRNGASTPEGKRHPSRVGSRDETKPRRFPDDALASPSSHMDDLIETRSARSASTTSRSTNRLSLTLPIVPATAYPLRPTPASSTTPAFPPTPLDTPSVMSPVDPNDFITAIAAQERRVLELREELNHAESDLARLKKQWATHEAYKKRTRRRNVEPVPGLGPAADLQDETAIRRSVELDRRKALLGQQSQLATPERSRRRVFTGSHTRTLSLLSPTKTTGPFSANDDEPESAKLDSDNRFAPSTLALQAKRASWAARSTQTAGVKQLAEDLKTGLWTFMEDLRQATVGDEPITGQGTYMRGRDGNMRPAVAGTPNSAGDQDTIRAPGNPRPRLSSAFDETPKASKQAEAENDDEDDDDNTTGPPRPTTLRRSKTDAGTRPTKRFSWTPLTIDSYDDNDWSNWDSPGVSSPRWSGTTVNGDIIPSIPEKRADEGKNTPLKNKPSKTRLARSPSPSSVSSPSSPNKLEDLLPQALNKLTPSNIKRTTMDFMKEWERSLASPDMAAPVAVTEVGKEKGV